VPRTFVVALAALAIVLSVTFGPRANAATSSLAWDSVTKLVTTGDASSLQPGSFDADFKTASTYEPPKQQGPVPGFLKAALANAQPAMQLVKNGIALKHYVAGTKERVDDVAMQTATIKDCSARTITTLDLKKKTYSVRSMDQPSSGGSSSGSGPNAIPTDDGTRITIDVKNTSLGAKEVGGVQTTGYQSDSTFTETKPSGETNTSQANLLAYYSTYAQPPTGCGRLMAGSRDASTMAQMGSIYERLTSAISMAGLDNRIKVTQSGPYLPVGKLSMYSAASFKGQGGRNATFLSEVGNVRPIDPSDPIFSVPSDFTKQ
jgi:hypothetical protein